MLPRLKPLSARKSAILSVLDVGTSKVVCLVAQLQPWDGAEGLSGRTHLARILGIGQHRSLGVKGGAIVDLEAVEGSIRHAVHAAERMAKVEIQSVIVNLTGGRIGSQRLSSSITARGAVGEAEIQRALRVANAGGVGQGRVQLHSIPLSYTLDAQGGIADPTGMLGEKLSIDLHVVGAQAAAARNLTVAIERCHLTVEAVVATPYAAGLSALSDDESEMGVVVIDCGGGTTSLGVFEAGHLVHADAIAVGGHHVTMDVARGFATRLAAAERLKTLHGACIAQATDERDLISVPPGGRGRARRRQPSAEIAPRADRPAAGRGDPRARARPAGGGGARCPARAGGSCSPAGRASSRGCRRRRAASSRDRSASAGRSGSRACRKRPRVRPSRPRWASWSIRRWRTPSGSMRAARPASRAAPRRKGIFSRVGRWLRESF